MTATLVSVTRAWIPSTPGHGLEEDIRTRLVSLGVRAPDLDLWVDLAHGPDRYRALTRILRTQAADDYDFPLPDETVAPRWPHTMLIDDAMAWVILSCQGMRVPNLTVRRWCEQTPHGWAFEAAGVTQPEAATGVGSWDWDTVRSMAALRGVRLPSREAGFTLDTGALSEGMRTVSS